MKKEQKASLLEPQATGGATAEGGFRFQDHLIVCRIPGWLKSAGFTGMLREGMGDTEAHFFTPGIGASLEFIEYKSYDLSPSDFWAEIDRFRQLDNDHPGVYNRFILVCTGVSQTIQPVVTALNRLRSTYNFYDNAISVQDASFAEFVETVKKRERNEDTARFLFHKVLIDTDPQKNEQQALASFRGELEKHFPVFSGLGRSQAESAWRNLEKLSTERRASPISRQELEKALWSSSDAGAEAVAAPVEMHTANELTPVTWDPDQKIIFRWGDFSGGEERKFPPQNEWQDGVIGQLLQARDWVIDTERSRKIILTGQRRLSAALAIGAIFSSVRGFDIDAIIRDFHWSTNAHADATTPAYEWQSSDMKGISDEISVAIGIGRDPETEVRDYIQSNGMHLPLLKLYSAAALTSAPQANLAVKNAKDVISTAIVRSKVKKIHLFAAVPSQFALFLGHRLNATATIQCYERVGVGEYQATCLIGGA